MTSATSQLRLLIPLFVTAALLGGGTAFAEAAAPLAAARLPALAQPVPPPPPPAPGPRPPAAQVALTFSQTQNILKQARLIVPRLSLGTPAACVGPGHLPGSLCAPLQLGGATVGEIQLLSDGTILPLGSLPPRPSRPDQTRPPVMLAPAALAQATRTLRSATISAALRVMGPQVRVTLLLGSEPITELAFDRAGKLLPLPPRSPLRLPNNVSSG